MRRYNLLIVGLLMVAPGAYLIFTHPQNLPLWFIWLAGPFLWYVGIAIAIGSIAGILLLPRTTVTLTCASSSDNIATLPAVASRQVPIEVLLLQIENHVRLEQAAAESFVTFPTNAQLRSKTTSPLVN